MYIKNFILVLFLMFAWISCKEQKETKFKSSDLELRQLVNNKETSTYNHSSFFLIGGSISQGTYVEDKIKCFAKVEGQYRVLEFGLTDIRVVINDSIEKPYLSIEYLHYQKLSDSKIIERIRWYSGVPIFYCPEKYIPEKILPIEL